MIRIKHAFLAFLGVLLCGGIAQAQEQRGLWADAWHAGFHSSGEVDALVNTAYNNNFNAIFAEVRLRGDAFYIPTYPNTEPRHSGIGSYDALADLVNKCHAKGIEIHAWIVTYPVLSATSNGSPQHVTNAHPEWIMRNSTGGNSYDGDKWLDPGVPDVSLWNYNVCMDLVQHYNIDGLNFDYIRYPNSDAGYNPISIARFNKEFGRTGQPGNADPTFSDWRRRQVTDLVKMVYANAIAIKPNIKITAAVFASRSDANNTRFQNWASWNQTGIMDAICPMNYTEDAGTFNSRCNDAVANSYGRHVYMAIGSSYANTLDEALYARSAGCQGIQIYSYYTGSGMLGSFKSNVCPTRSTIPLMTWKSSPTVGYIKGNVMSVGTRLYNARMSLTQSGANTLTDGTGFYAFTKVTPGTYTVNCSADGCQDTAIPVTVTAGKVSTIDFDLLAGNTPTPTNTPTPWPTNIPYYQIVDNADQGYSDSGWINGTYTSSAYNGSYRYCTNVYGGRWASWTPDLSKAGDYFVSVWYVQGSNRASNAAYTVNYQGDSRAFTIDQRGGGGQWIPLGVFRFPQGSSGNVTLTNDWANGNVIADAVQFAFIDPPATFTPTPTNTPLPTPTKTPRTEGTFIQILGRP